MGRVSLLATHAKINSQLATLRFNDVSTACWQNSPKRSIIGIFQSLLLLVVKQSSRKAWSMIFGLLILAFLIFSYFLNLFFLMIVFVFSLMTIRMTVLCAIIATTTTMIATTTVRRSTWTSCGKHSEWRWWTITEEMSLFFYHSTRRVLQHPLAFIRRSSFSDGWTPWQFLRTR